MKRTGPRCSPRSSPALSPSTELVHLTLGFPPSGPSDHASATDVVASAKRYVAPYLQLPSTRTLLSGLLSLLTFMMLFAVLVLLLVRLGGGCSNLYGGERSEVIQFTEPIPLSEATRLEQLEEEKDRSSRWPS